MKEGGMCGALAAVIIVLVIGAVVLAGMIQRTPYRQTVIVETTQVTESFPAHALDKQAEVAETGMVTIGATAVGMSWAHAASNIAWALVIVAFAALVIAFIFKR